MKWIYVYSGHEKLTVGHQKIYGRNFLTLTSGPDFRNKRQIEKGVREDNDGLSQPMTFFL
jgi:hypothetical protein